MPPTPDKLLSLASQIRSLVARRDSPAERVESAGRLLMAAIDAAAFTALPDYESFVALVRQRHEQRDVNGRLSAWTEAVWFLRGKLDDPPDPEATFGADCELVASQILESVEPPARSDDASGVLSHTVQEAPPAKKPATKAARRQRRRMTLPVEMTPKQEFVYALRTGSPCPSFGQIAKVMSEHFHEPIGDEAARRLYRRAVSVKETQGASIQPRLALHSDVPDSA